MFLWAIINQYFPYKNYLGKYSHKVVNYFYPYIQIKFNEFTGEQLMHSEAHSAIEAYLTTNSSMQARRLKANMLNNGQSLALSLDDHEEVTDEYKGVKLWWHSGKEVINSESFSFCPTTNEKRYYTLTFHKRNKELVIGPYLGHVLKEGRAIKVNNRQRKLYTNSGSWWSHVVFEHPATFQTLAMDANKKQEIIDDLVTFSNSEEFYAKIGRAWKRGYLLYGPPGSGKSTLISAMANFLGYDVYDLELTAVLAKNYLNIDSHEYFGKIRGLLEEVNITAADVAENLMPKTPKAYAGSCLESVIETLEIVKEEAKAKAEMKTKRKRRNGVLKIDGNGEKGNLGNEESEEKKEMKRS